jgi:GNAT superfamily N-acetyltransferase
VTHEVGHEVRIEEQGSPSAEEALELYASVGWTAYTRDPAGLAKAIGQSSFFALARQGERLVGLARCLSDDVSVAYLQDLLVRPEHRRVGVGSQLLGRCLARYAHVRNFVLLTDDSPEQHAFYGAHGLTNVAATRRPRLNAYVRLLGV